MNTEQLVVVPQAAIDRACDEFDSNIHRKNLRGACRPYSAPEWRPIRQQGEMR